MAGKVVMSVLKPVVHVLVLLHVKINPTSFIKRKETLKIVIGSGNVRKYRRLERNVTNGLVTQLLYNIIVQ